MATFSISDVAFTGFRIVREKPMAVLTWAGVGLVVNIAFTVLMISMAGSALTQMQALPVGAQSDPTTALRLMSQLAPLYLILFVFSMVFYGVIYAAMNRAVLRPAEDQFGYLRLGADELRQLAVLLLLGLVIMAIYIASIFGVVIVGGILAFAVSLVAKGASAVIFPLIMILAVFGIFFGLIYVVIRLSLAPALTFDKGRVNLFGSWDITRGKFWPMFGAYFISNIMVTLLALLAFAIMAGIMFAMAGGLKGVTGLMRPDMSTLAVYFTPVRILVALIYPLIYAVLIPVALTPPAAIYRALTADRQTKDVEAVFS